MRFSKLASSLIFLCFVATSTIAQESNRALELADVEQHLDLVFAEVDGIELKLDLYLPRAAGGPAPLLVWIHGGGWRAGSRNPPRLKQLLGDGIAIASISYRFTDKATFPAQIHDCKAAIRWLKAHAGKYGYDGERMAVAGSSAGGHLALMIGVSSGVESMDGNVGEFTSETTNVRCVVDYFGPSDFVLRGRTQPERAYTSKSGSLALLGGTVDKRPSTQSEQEASPVTYVDAKDPPLLIFQGDRDTTVLPDQSERMRDVYAAAGLDVELVVLPDAGHGGTPFFTGESYVKVRDFLSKHLKP